MHYSKSKSKIACAVHADADSYAELDADPNINPCGGTPDCGNKEALEDLLVAATAHWFTVQMKLPFQQIVYAPNRYIERRCGFDLSIAPVNTKNVRLRIQSKINPTWCDTENTIELSAKRHPGGDVRFSTANRLHHQIELLGRTSLNSEKKAYPYLLVQQCYCLHDYRRMGREVQNVKLPDIEDPLRSIVIDLSEESFIDKCLNEDSWMIQIQTDPKNARATCNGVMGGGQTISLAVRTLKDLVKQLKG